MQFDVQHDIGHDAGCPAIAVGEGVNPVEPPQQISGEMYGALLAPALVHIIAHVGNIDADFGFVYKGIGKLCKDQAIIRTRQSHAQSRWEQKWTSQPTTQLQWLE